MTTQVTDETYTATAGGSGPADQPAAGRTYPRKVTRAMKTLCWLVVCWIGALCVADALEVASNKAVVLPLLAASTVFALWLTWGDGKESS